MANFCKYCGAPLEDGQVCSCPQAQFDAAQPQAAPQQQQTVPQQQVAPRSQAAFPSSISAAFGNLWPFFKTYLRSPANATRLAVDQSDLVLAIVLLAIQAIVAGFAALSVVFKTAVANILVRGVTGLLNGSWDVFNRLIGPSVAISFILSPLFAILAAAIAIMIFTALIFAAAKIMKSNCSFKDAIIACGANSPFVTILLLLVFLLFFVSIPLGVAIFVLAMLTWIIMGVPTAQALIPDAEQGKFWMLYIAVVLVTLLVGGWISGSLLSVAMGSLWIF